MLTNLHRRQEIVGLFPKERQTRLHHENLEQLQQNLSFHFWKSHIQHNRYENFRQDQSLKRQNSPEFPPQHSKCLTSWQQRKPNCRNNWDEGSSRARLNHSQYSLWKVFVARSSSINVSKITTKPFISLHQAINWNHIFKIILIKNPKYRKLEIVIQREQ